MMFCPKCGSKNDDGAQFCSSCGNKLNVAPEAKQAPAVSTTATGAVTVGDGTTAAAAHKTGRILVVIGVVVVLGVAIAAFVTGGFGLMGPKYEVKASVDAYSWGELANISEEIAKAASEDAAVEVAKTYNLTTSDGKLDGNQVKFVTLSDGTQAAVQIAGFAHDDKTDGGKTGITFIFKDAIARHDMNYDATNTGGWERSAMRSWLSSEALGMLPEDLRGQIAAVDKLTNNVGETTDISSVTTTSDRLWLFSPIELCGLNGWTFSDEESAYKDILEAEGSEYKLFRDVDVNGVDANTILTKTFEGESCYWWGRSPNPGYSGGFLDVYTDGYPHIGVSARGTYGVVPGFCI